MGKEFQERLLLYQHLEFLERQKQYQLLLQQEQMELDYLLKMQVI